jgi:hypothetical protein
MMKCGSKCENAKLQMEEYQFKSHMFAIEMGGRDVVLGVEYLQALGPITMDFKELYMSFTKEGHQDTLKGLKSGSSEILSSHCMEKLLKKEHCPIQGHSSFRHPPMGNSPAFTVDPN